MTSPAEILTTIIRDIEAERYSDNDAGYLHNALKDKLVPALIDWLNVRLSDVNVDNHDADRLADAFADDVLWPLRLRAVSDEESAPRKRGERLNARKLGVGGW